MKKIQKTILCICAEIDFELSENRNIKQRPVLKNND